MILAINLAGSEKAVGCKVIHADRQLVLQTFDRTGILCLAEVRLCYTTYTKASAKSSQIMSTYRNVELNSS